MLFIATATAILLIASVDAPAARRYRRPRTAPPASPSNSMNATNQPAADSNLKKFKDVPVNAVFCYPTDRTHEWFPLMKISETQAKTLTSQATRVSTVQVVSQEAIVYLSKKKAPASGKQP